MLDVKILWTLRKCFGVVIISIILCSCYAAKGVHEYEYYCITDDNKGSALLDSSFHVGDTIILAPDNHKIVITNQLWKSRHK